MSNREPESIEESMRFVKWAAETVVRKGGCGLEGCTQATCTEPARAKATLAAIAAYEERQNVYARCVAPTLAALLKACDEVQLQRNTRTGETFVLEADTRPLARAIDHWRVVHGLIGATASELRAELARRGAL